MFEQQQGVGLDTAFYPQFRFFLNREGRFVIDAPEPLDQKLTHDATKS